MSSSKPPSVAWRGLQLGCMGLASLFLGISIAIVIGIMMVMWHPPTQHSAVPPLHGFGFGIGLTFPGPSGPVPVGFTSHPWNIPGSILGAVIGIASFVLLVIV